MSTELALERKYVNGVFLMGGIISLIFGVLLITRTQGVIEVIMLLLGLWWLIQGLFNILAIFIDNSQWGLKLIGGALGVIAGLLVLNFPLVGGFVRQHGVANHVADGEEVGHRGAQLIVHVDIATIRPPDADRRKP